MADDGGFTLPPFGIRHPTSVIRPTQCLIFSLEGFAFFTDAIFLGIYLYGWTKLSPRAHWWAGVAVMVSGTVSGIFVVFANAWMNAPAGFELVNGAPTNIDPIAAMLNPASFHQTLHMTLAAFATTGIAVAGIHAWMLRKHPADHFHRSALHVALLVAIPASLLQPLSGDSSAKFVAKYQPAKLAAMEGQFETERGAPLRIGGIPNEATRETKYTLEIPKALSFLAFSDFESEVQGLEAFPEEDWPPAAITHFAFEVMVGLGTSGRLTVMGALLTQPWAVPFQVLTGALAVTAIAALLTRRYRLARAAAAPAITLRLVSYGLVGGAFVLVPSLWYLFRVFKSDSSSAFERVDTTEYRKP